MTFYEQQAQARQLTRLLVLLYGCGVVVLAMLSSLFLSLMFIPLKLAWWSKVATSDQPLFSLGQFLTLAAIILSTSLFVSYLRYRQLHEGGWQVAKALGGRRLLPNTAELSEQRLRNVVEEMAIASGLPVPALFIQDAEQGINAFAAGMTINDAVIVITRGALYALERDELQAVVAHEFSHIRNGDIRLNMQLAAALAGLLFIERIADLLTGDGSGEHGQGGHGRGVFEWGCHAVGYGGVLFSQLIKAAVNRQREVLADASAVQFTRHPLALANALKKVAGHPYASLIFHPAAKEYSHLFFGQGQNSSFSGRLATHPPLSERIRQLEPEWDGKYIRGSVNAPIDEYREEHDLPLNQRQQRQQERHEQLAVLDFNAPDEWLDLLPPELVAAAHDPLQAQLLVYALLLDTDIAIRHRQLNSLPDPERVDELTRYELPRRLRLGLLELTLPSLQLMTQAEYETFRDHINTLSRADGESSMFEWLLYRLLDHQLHSRFTPRANPGMVRDINELQAAIAELSAALAYHCASEQSQITLFYQHIMEQLQLNHPLAPHCPDLAQMATALSQLQRASPGIRLRLVQAVVTAIELDGQVSDTEFELFRLLAVCLECPIPPPQPGAAPLH
ncbi:MAG: M48 family metalloprotease [Aeromonadaceae bacterium]